MSYPSESSATDQPPDGKGLTLAQYAGFKRLAVAFLERLGCVDLHYVDAPAVKIPYRDVAGTEVAARFRIALTGDRFRWRRGSKLLLYGLWLLAMARKAGFAVIVEGESDCHTLWSHGIPAIGLPGAGNWDEERDAAFFEGIPVIYVIIEPDKGGEAVRGWIDRSRIRERVKVVTLGAFKDPSALHCDDPERFKERFQEALAKAEPWQSVADRVLKEVRAKAWEECRELAESPNILARFAAELRALGVVGEEKVAGIIFLALVSRFLDRPVSVVVKGPSSAGKSYVALMVLVFFPDGAYYILTAMSERALAYSTEPLMHRFLVLYEAAGMKGDFASYLIRSLLSEGRVRYETVEKTPQGLRPRLIEREGPTGLILTTTSVHLHPENETRMFSVTVTDTQEQTKAILRSLAEDRDETVKDLGNWHALQKWLELSDHEVVIPYARALAEKIPPIAVRLRRDFKAVLNLIRASAILHQAKRERDDRGRIIATLDDYAMVRDLVAGFVAEGVEAAVSKTVRETVEAVVRLVGGKAEGVTVNAVAAELKLDKSAASRRVRAALELGYLQNEEERKGRPAKLLAGEPLPEETEVLPAPELLEDHGEALEDEEAPF